MSGALIQARGLVPYELDDRLPLDVDIHPERLVCLVGANNTGKSAWLRALAGLDQPEHGDLEIMGQDVWSMSTPQWRELRTSIGFVAESAPLLSMADGLTNLLIPALYHHVADEDSLRDEALQLLDDLGWDGDETALPAFMDHHHLRMLALARCLMLGPEAIFLDEPFTLVDEHSRRAMERQLVRLVRERGITLVVSTHNLGFAEREADLVLFADPQGLHTYEAWETLRAERSEFLAGRTQVFDMNDLQPEAPTDGRS